MSWTVVGGPGSEIPGDQVSLCPDNKQPPPAPHPHGRSITKIAVAWATNDEVTDGILIRTTTGEQFHLTAIASRDELFNRLVAIGTQAWEEW